MEMSDCAFCVPTVTDVQEVARFNTARVVYPWAPTIEENLLVIPIDHVERFEQLTPEQVVDIHSAISSMYRVMEGRVGATAFNVFINNGLKAGQSVPHVHFHVFYRHNHEAVSPYTKWNHPDRYPVATLTAPEVRRRALDLRADLVARGLATP